MLRVAAGQVNAHVGDLDGNVERVLDVVRRGRAGRRRPRWRSPSSWLPGIHPRISC
ncbi:MAG: hypothetical protein U5R31_17380 [Acidimicrobiia bacterium]|nr:hypothetical protein [Acidimicrobiia bacterium]